MLLDTEVQETPMAAVVGGSPYRRQLTSLRPRHSRPLLLMVAGLAVCSAATALAVTARTGATSGRAAAGSRRAAAVTAGVDVGGPADIAAQIATYGPGQSSGWHSHTGLHAVVVLTGTLTIVDGDCTRHTYGPGESYIGGRDVHLAVNETAAPVQMTVTYMFPAGVSHTGFHVAATAPPGCDIA